MPAVDAPTKWRLLASVSVPVPEEMPAPSGPDETPPMPPDQPEITPVRDPEPAPAPPVQDPQPLEIPQQV